MENNLQELQSNFCPFGYLDIKMVCDIWENIWLREDEIFDIIDDYKEDIWEVSFSKIDPVYVLLEHILQMARNYISEITDYDFINDFSWSETGIYTHGNYMCSTYDYSENAKKQLSNKVTWKLDILVKNKWCNYFLSELEIGE